MKFKQRRGVLLGILCSCSYAVTAQTYYVNVATGNDIYEGKSEGKAWRTVGRVNEHKFKPGDRILFKAGQQWFSRIKASNSGSSDGFVVYGKHGEGENPLIDIQYVEDNAFYTDKSYIRIENIDFSNTKNNTLVFVNSHYIELYNINVSYEPQEPGSIHPQDIGKIGNNGIAFQGGGGQIYINNVAVSYAPNNGILIRGDNKNHIGNVTVKNSYISHALLNDGITIHEDCCGGIAGSEFLIEGNVAKYCWEQGFDITTGSHITLKNNISRNNGEGGIMLGHSASNIVIDNHTSLNEPYKKKAAALLVSVSEVLVKNSIFKGNGHHLLKIIGLKGRSINNILITNNVFEWNGGSSVFDIVGMIDGLNVESNIFKSTTGNFRVDDQVQRVIRFRDKTHPPDNPALLFKNNLYEATDGVVRFQMILPSGDQYSFNLDQFKKDYGQESSNVRKNSLR